MLKKATSLFLIILVFTLLCSIAETQSQPYLTLTLSNVYVADGYTVAPHLWDWWFDGMDDYTDDANGILTGSLPYLQGFYFVFGHYTEGSSGATSFVDHIECFKQINP